MHGRLAATDVRWAAVAASVDDRTPMERGLPHPSTPPWDDEQLGYLAGRGVVRLPKSRYESISHFLANCSGCTDIFNDIDAPIDEHSLQLCREAGIDDNLSRHIAHLFVRDPLVIRPDRIDLDDEIESDHFEIIQSTNWQTVRWKPPPKRKPGGPHVGWRVEFRSMEAQFTDFENAAFTVFVVLVSRVILAFDLNLYIPLSKVDENMRRAHSRNAVSNERFYFRATERASGELLDSFDGACAAAALPPPCHPTRQTPRRHTTRRCCVGDARRPCRPRSHRHPPAGTTTRGRWRVLPPLRHADGTRDDHRRDHQRQAGRLPRAGPADLRLPRGDPV